MPADASAIEQVARESWHAAYDDFLGEDTVREVVNEWYDCDGLRDSAGDDDQVLVVATDESENTDVRGFAHAAPDPDPERDVWPPPSHLRRTRMLERGDRHCVA